ncbi:MAG: hypothetical protein CMK89_07665 [Pseudomonadales bacterium]|nr:hypothetical protein [Pseudomonadales bacterium]
MSNGEFSNRIDASTMSDKIDGERRITGVQLFVPFNYPTGTSTAGTHYEVSLEDAQLLMREIQKTLDLAIQINDGKTVIPVPTMLIDGKGDPGRHKQMQDALGAINQKHGNKE